MSLTEILDIAIDSVPQQLGDGVPRARTLHLTDYPVPLWVRIDLNPLQVAKVELMPADLAVYGGFVELLSSEAGPAPIPPVDTGFFVSPTGSALNDGSKASPWSLAHALSGAGGVIQPGDLINIRGGSYGDGSITSTSGFAGTSTARVVFRQYGGDAPLGERAIFDGTLEVETAYTDVRGIEVFQSDPNAFPGVVGHEGIVLGTGAGDATGSRVINCVIHDCAMTGITHWLNCHGGVIYGVISYNNGTNHNLDHGFYTHDSEYVVDTCIAFNNLARGFQGYDSARDQRNVIFRKLISFGNGEISTVVDKDYNYVARVLSPRVMENFVLEDFVGFHKPPSGGKGQQLRFGTFGNVTGQVSAFVRRAYLWGGNVNVEFNDFQNLTVEEISAIDSGATQPVLLLREIPSASVVWQNNTWYRDPTLNRWTFRASKYIWDDWRVATGLGNTDTATALPPPTTYFLFINEYSQAEDKGRGHLAIFNHDGLASVPVDISDVIRVGESYEIRNVQDLWGTPVVSGVYAGGDVNVPMTTGVAPPTPIGATRVFATPPTTAPDFDCFLVLKV